MWVGGGDAVSGEGVMSGGGATGASADTDAAAANNRVWRSKALSKAGVAFGCAAFLPAALDAFDLSKFAKSSDALSKPNEAISAWLAWMFFHRSHSYGGV